MVKVQAESEEVRKAGRAQIPWGPGSHHVLWGLDPNVDEESLEWEPRDTFG